MLLIPSCICLPIKYHSRTSFWKADYSVQNSFSTNIPSSVVKIQDICLRLFFLSTEICLFHHALYFRPSTFEAWHFNGSNSHDTHLHVLFTPRCHFHFKPDLPICLCNTYPFACAPFLYMQKRNAERDWRRRAIFLNLIWRFWEEKRPQRNNCGACPRRTSVTSWWQVFLICMGQFRYFVHWHEGRQ